jgi:hypothetical protein
MIRVSLTYIFDLATALEAIEKLPDGPVPLSQVIFDVFSPQSSLTTLYDQTLYRPYLRSSHSIAQELVAALNVITDNLSDANRQIQAHEIWAIKDSYRRFKIALRAELGILHSYFVTQKGGLDTVSLLAFGENLFPDDLVSKVPEALFDVKEAGKCLAYETPTAAGFHIFRATESVLRKYYLHMTNGAAPPKVRSIKVYTKALRLRKVGTQKLLSSLDQMAELHRNPLIHPEAVLSQEEAYGVFGIARSVIGFMLGELPAISVTTSTPTLPAP